LKVKVECGVDACYQRAADIEVSLLQQTYTMKALIGAQNIEEITLENINIVYF